MKRVAGVEGFEVFRLKSSEYLVWNGANNAWFVMPRKAYLTEVKPLLEGPRKARLVDALRRAAEGVPAWHRAEPEAGSLKSAYFNIVDACNLNCAYCYSAKRSPSRLSLADIRRVIDSVAEVGGRDGVEFSFIGGEPLLHPAIGPAVSYAKSRLSNAALITNGTLLAGMPSLDFLQGVHVQVSLDHYSVRINDRTRGATAKVLQGLRRLLKEGIPFSVAGTLTADNIGHALENFAFWRQRGIACSYFVCKAVGGALANSVAGPSPQAVAALTAGIAKELGSYQGALAVVKYCDQMSFSGRSMIETCAAGKYSVSIDPRGDVYPCVKLHSPELRMGNVLADGMASIFARAGRLTETIRRPVTAIEGCRQCAFRFLCGGGCRAEKHWADPAGSAARHPQCGQYLDHIEDSFVQFSHFSR